ncbi:MAG TPA: alcohol dehydrogenase catalytic domain-containing protein [Kofleriaceae bacterium]|nr:alcohol dehydrogenase catalytic domain-containing protein [Kofleriaceae bacterium]
MSGAPAELAGDRIRVQIEAAVCAEPELAALAASASRASASAASPATEVVEPGGAAVGRVVDAGEGAAHMRGRRVVVGPIDPCGECERCRRGLPFACGEGRALGVSAPGALAGEVTVRARWATELGGGLDVAGPLAALLAREAADAYALHARCGLAAGEPAVVLGRGPVARLAAQIAAARGARVVAGSAGDATTIERVTAHLAEHAGGGRPIKIIAAAGGADAGDDDELGLALRLARPGALVAVLARSPVPSPDGRDVAALVAGGGALVGVPGAHPDLVPEVAALAVKGEIDLAAAAEVRAAIADPTALAAAARAALATGRALVVTR